MNFCVRYDILFADVLSFCCKMGEFMEKEIFSISGLRVDGLPAGAIFCASTLPSLSWQMESSAAGCMQRTYRIIAEDENGSLLWDSGVVTSGDSAGIRWGGAPLASRQQVFWQVEVENEKGEKAVSGKSFFETPLFSNSDWSAQWIWFDGNNPTLPSPLPYFRKEFTAGKVVRARLYAGCRGNCELHLNGKVISADRLAPGWSDFRKHIQFLSYDVTGFIQDGENCIGAIVSDGWYCSYLSGRRRDYYGEHPELLLQLELFYADGSVEKVLTSSGWRTTTGPYLNSDIYDGETYDFRLEMPGWDKCGFDDRKWREARLGEMACASTALIPKCCVPVRKIGELQPVKLLRTANGELIWDFGQNISGGIRIRNLKCYGGILYTIRYGEMLNQDGSLYNMNFRSAKSCDSFTTSGNGTTVMEYETKFTFHGFRYVQIDGPQYSRVDPEDLIVTAVVMHSELETTGNFECGHAKLNRLYQNVCWGQRDNFVDVPTDCPQRDERLGWTGDAQIFCGTAAINMNVLPFFRKYLCDMRDGQAENGLIPSVVPDLFSAAHGGAAAWADAAVICPWKIFMAYADKQILEENFDMMCRWVDYQKNTSNDLIRPKTSYGDWLALSPVETPSEIIGTSYFARTAELTGKAAGILGKSIEAEYYTELSRQVKAAYAKKFIDSSGMVNPATQTSLALALHFNLLPEELRERNAAGLAQLVVENGNKLNTGFVGTAYLNLALSESGHPGTACDLYLQEEYPSWLFSVNQGATTMWERWNSYTVKDGFGDVNMNSFNHYAYGAVHEWVMRHICGIRLTSPGGKEILFAAEPDKRIGFVNSSLATPYGKIESCWRLADDKLFWHISAPANTLMKVNLPKGWQCAEKVDDLPCGSYDLVLYPEK